MASVTYNTCGPIIYNPDWSDAFNTAIARMERGRGATFSYEEKEGQWELFQSSGGGTLGPAPRRRLAYKVGTPLSTINTETGYQQIVANGDPLTIPTGYKEIGVQVEQSDLEPIDANYIVSGQVLAFVTPVEDANVYVDVIATGTVDTLRYIVTVGTPIDTLSPGNVSSQTVTNGASIAIPAGYLVDRVQVAQSPLEPVSGSYSVAAGVLSFGFDVVDTFVYLRLKQA